MERLRKTVMFDAVQYTGQTEEEFRGLFDVLTLSGILYPHGKHEDKFVWVMGLDEKWIKCFVGDWIITTEAENRFGVKKDREYQAYKAMLQATSQINPGEYFDEGTLLKVLKALTYGAIGEGEGLTEAQAMSAMTRMQNAGILFREFKQ